MPNWCYNHLEINANADYILPLKEVIQKIIKENDGKKEYPKLFSLFYPIPEELLYTVGYPPSKTDEEIQALTEKYGAGDWYEWSLKNWGCKWDACDIDIQESNDDFIHLYFNTPWSPPIGFYTKLANDYKVNIYATYSEEGMSFCGKWQSTVKDNEVFIREDDHNTDEMQGDILSRYLVINKNKEETPDDFLDKVRYLYEKIYPEVCDYYDAEEMFSEWWFEDKLEDEKFCKQYGIINKTIT